MGMTYERHDLHEDMSSEGVPTIKTTNHAVTRPSSILRPCQT